MMSPEEQAQVIAVAEARGNHPSGLRDAVHEICHVIDTDLVDLADWDREAIHAAIQALEPSDQFRLEVRARAAEAVACKLASIDYKLDQWAALAAMESMKNRGVTTSLENWMFGINTLIDNGTGAELLERVRELCSRS